MHYSMLVKLTSVLAIASSIHAYDLHCKCVSCNTDDDCSDVLTCINRTCGGVSSTNSAPAGIAPTVAAPPASTAVSCSWASHRKGAKCGGDDDDCSDVLTCIKNVCGGPVGVMSSPFTSPTNVAPPKCEWAGHCAGSKCSSDNDCSDVLTCQKGVCAK
ncbi:hypothetical protein DL98DRAFT_652868 [Cadophora sp. DSE1049]|nr:hypothetical protein DL98DRAFT_652868 [Cadophora sp. DSE1049]